MHSSIPWRYTSLPMIATAVAVIWGLTHPELVTAWAVPILTGVVALWALPLARIALHGRMFPPVIFAEVALILGGWVVWQAIQPEHLLPGEVIDLPQVLVGDSEYVCRNTLITNFAAYDYYSRRDQIPETCVIVKTPAPQNGYTYSGPDR